MPTVATPNRPDQTLNVSMPAQVSLGVDVQSHRPADCLAEAAGEVFFSHPFVSVVDTSGSSLVPQRVDQVSDVVE